MNSSKMKLLELVPNVKKQFTIIEEIMVVVNGAHLHLPTQEISVPISGGQSLEILGTLFDHAYSLLVRLRSRANLYH
ncbi:MAG: hypothetical protein ACFFDT_35860 [Candidatus Hodarchaeota archaeon]